MSSSPSRAAWLQKMAALRVDRARGRPAPHKPLLLLAVLDLAEAGLLGQGDLLLTGEVTFRFLAYWKAVAADRSSRPDVRLPFFHLKSEGFWQPLDEGGAPAVHSRTAARAYLDEDFRGCLFDADFRRQARLVLASRYFPPAGQTALETALGISLPATAFIAEALPDLALEQAAGVGREARFRLTVVPAYDFTCALTGYRLVTVDAGSVVDAAHIRQFAESGNNDPANGIALSKNAHWLFDQGLWSITDDFRVLVATDRFHESGPESLQLAGYAGRSLRVPEDPRLTPGREHLRWHRERHGFTTSRGRSRTDLKRDGARVAR